MSGRRWIVGLATLTLAGCLSGGEGEECAEAAECAEGLFCTSEQETGSGRCARDVTRDPGRVFLDPTTGLEWQVTPSIAPVDWAGAVAHCRDLELDGPGWRLPTIGELRTLIRSCPPTETGGPCRITDECLSFDVCETGECWGCDVDAGPAGGCYWPDGIEGDCTRFYWSSSTIEEVSDRAFYVIFAGAHMSVRTKSFFFGHARCVR